MLGYLIGGTSFGFLSFQAYKKRQENKKSQAIHAQVSEDILSPSEWSETEDVYSLKSQMLSKQLEAQGIQRAKNTYFSKTRSVLSDKYSQFKNKQYLLFTRLYHSMRYPSSNTSSSSSPTTTDNSGFENLISNQGVQHQQQSQISQQKDALNQDNQSPSSQNTADIILEKFPQSPQSSIKGMYQSFVTSHQRKTEERQIEKVKQQIISPNGTCRQEGSPNRKTYDLSEMNCLKSPFRKSIDNYKRYFSESTIGRQSVVFTEYKGQEPKNALNNFLKQCQSYIPVKKAMIIHYFYGKSAPSSYVIAVEYMPIEHEGVEENIATIQGAATAELKKTDAFKCSFNVEKNESQNLSAWINREQESQCLLKEAIESEVESKMNIGGIRQMKYIEVFNLDEKHNVIGYEVQVPYGQNEAVYDLRSKSQAANVQYHSSFRQFDIYSPNKSS